MKKTILLFTAALILIAFTGCESTKSVIDENNTETIEEPIIDETENTEPAENSKGEKKSEETVVEETLIFDENGLPLGDYVVMENFEDGNFWMPVGNSWNDGDTSIDDQTTEEWGTEGPTSLKCIYTTEHAEFEKAGYYCESPLEIDWTGAKFVVIDVNNPNEYDITIDIVLQTGEAWNWNQAEPQVCPPGLSTIVFDISKTTDLDSIGRMIVYLFGTPEDTGFFYFDNYRVVF